MINENFKPGDQFIIPDDQYYNGDIFTITAVRRSEFCVLLDGVCNSDNSIVISVNSYDVERF